MPKSLYDIAFSNTLEHLLASDLSQEGFRMLLIGLLLRYRFNHSVLNYLQKNLKKGNDDNEI